MFYKHSVITLHFFFCSEHSDRMAQSGVQLSGDEQDRHFVQWFKERVGIFTESSVTILILGSISWIICLIHFI